MHNRFILLVITNLKLLLPHELLLPIIFKQYNLLLGGLDHAISLNLAPVDTALVVDEAVALDFLEFSAGEFEESCCLG